MDMAKDLSRVYEEAGNGPKRKLSSDIVLAHAEKLANMATDLAGMTERKLECLIIPEPIPENKTITEKQELPPFFETFNAHLDIIKISLNRIARMIEKVEL